MPEAEADKAPRSRAFAIRLVAILVAIAVVGFAAFMLTNPSERPRGALIGGAFALEDGAGKTVSDQTLKGRPFLVYFGYTHCPDVCPTELARISDILGKMGDKAIPTLFITVDPERDTPKGDAGLCQQLQSRRDRAFRKSPGGGSNREDLSGLRPQGSNAARRRLFDGPQFDRLSDGQERRLR